MKWVIIAVDGSRLFWSNAVGWTTLVEATQFDDADLFTFNPPTGGAWMSMSRV